MKGEIMGLVALLREEFYKYEKVVDFTEMAERIVADGWAFVPEGSVVVPKEPTPEMVNAGTEEGAPLDGDFQWSASPRGIWRAMCIAASTGE